VVFDESKMDGGFHSDSKVAKEPRVDFYRTIWLRFS